VFEECRSSGKWRTWRSLLSCSRSQKSSMRCSSSVMEIPEEIARHSVASGAPDDRTAVLRQVIGHAHFAPIHQLKRQVVDVLETLVEKRQHVVIGVHV